MIIGTTAGLILHRSKPALPDTGEVLAGMLSENTGIHGMDSGGAFGRHWQRNQGMTKADWEALPSGFMMDGECPVIRTYHFLNDRLVITETSEKLNRAYRAIYDADPDVMNTQHVEVLEVMGWEGNSWYSYNGDNLLSQDFIWTDFQVGTELFTVISTHNGADARGGFSTPYVFAISGADECWAYDLDQCDLYCPECKIRRTWGYSFNEPEWYFMGQFQTTLPGTGEPDREREEPEGWELKDGCPQCQGALEVSSVEPS